MVGTNPVSLPPGAVLILDFDEECYRFAEVRGGWRQLLDGVGCPACGGQRFGHHGSYWKYLYRRLIQVLRVRCRECRRTHAVLPSCSLPGTSLGTQEVERYLLERDRGLSRRQAVTGGVAPLSWTHRQ